jgi:REP element-mobilizing transposase RayT
MEAVLSWTVYGAWFDAPGRGRIERSGAGPAAAVPEPRPELAAERVDELKWPPVRLDERQRRAVLEDLRRVAELRSFELGAAVVAPDHVHVLLRCEDDRDVPRLVQLTKGALSRALSVAAGDPAAADRGGATAAHHRWWSHQHSFLVLDEATRAPVLESLRRCAAGEERTVWGERG